MINEKFSDLLFSAAKKQLIIEQQLEKYIISIESYIEITGLDKKVDYESECEDIKEALDRYCYVKDLLKGSDSYPIQALDWYFSMYKN